AADTGEHAEREYVALQETHRIEIVLVPLDHGALGHGRVLDRDEFVEPAASDHEAADVLGEMAGKADERARKLEREKQRAIPSVEPERPHLTLLDRLGAPAPDRLGELLRRGGPQSQRLADFADG